MCESSGVLFQDATLQTWSVRVGIGTVGELASLAYLQVHNGEFLDAGIDDQLACLCREEGRGGNRQTFLFPRR